MTYPSYAQDAEQASPTSFTACFLKRLHQTDLSITEKDDIFEIDTGRPEMAKVDRITLSKESIAASRHGTFEDLKLEYCPKLGLKNYRTDLYHVHPKHLEIVEIALMEAWHDAKAAYEETAEKQKLFLINTKIMAKSHNGHTVKDMNALVMR